jgi:hypothetical protein
VLDRQTVEIFLSGASFRANMIDEAYLGLSYHRSSGANGGSCPVFKLTVVKE